jgi:hypothetical protein
MPARLRPDSSCSWVTGLNPFRLKSRPAHLPSEPIPLVTPWVGSARLHLPRGSQPALTRGTRPCPSGRTRRESPVVHGTRNASYADHIPPSMDPLFGSETRARVLEQLALTPRPQSAYRIAKAIGAEPIQVLRILKRLREVADHAPAGWMLTDERLRRFLRERSARHARRRRSEKDALLVHLGLRPSLEYGRRHLPGQVSPPSGSDPD